ncbi:MAG TPA: helix-turn-helix transcriptional regulator, partial [Ktedonobacteraceae bacterium]|nr:helix-turn-helix transcriptional regulator [Ktedonobacteraceae bacterium]
MKPKDQRTPNLLLRHQRLVRGWSLQRVVNEICALAEPDGRIPGVSAAMVSCWEMGKKKPSPFYQERLCLIYGLAADQLGFMEVLAMPQTKLPGRISALAPASETAHQVMPIPFTCVVPREQIQAIDLLIDNAHHRSDEQLGAWLTLGAHHLSMLLDAGWSPANVLDAVRVVLQGVQGLPAITRRKLLQFSGAASIIGIT